MILISHRGNIEGKNLDLENSPDYIDRAIMKGYDVEVDLWLKENTFFLGHDEPQYLIDLEWITSRKKNLWLHCKNLNCFTFLTTYTGDMYRFFWHQKDDYALTSNHMIWAYPNQPLSDRSIAVMPESTNYTIDQLKQCTGICSDFITNYREFK